MGRTEAPAAGAETAVAGEARPILLVASEIDPVARRLAEVWGAVPPTDWTVDGVRLRRWAKGPYYIRRPTLHIHDEQLDTKLPPELLRQQPTLVFPSIHRSRQNIRCLTVHPLGNPGASAEVGGRPRSLVPTDPELMTATLRVVADEARALGRTTTYEATHHGPELSLPAFFVEIGYGDLPGPPEEEIACLARILPSLSRPAGGNRIALGVGGGHYAPHFTDLALRRRWAFGHILSRHALEEVDPATAREALRLTPRAEGILYARASDQQLPALGDLAPRLREGDAPGLVPPR